METKPKFAEYFSLWGILIAVLFCAIGLCLKAWAPMPIVESAGEATFIAGLLSLAVDPILRARLLKEAANDIFHHILGFNQQPEIKDRLHDIVTNTKLYRKDFRMRIKFSESGDDVHLHLAYEFCLLNPTNQSQEFTQHLAWEEGERPSNCKIWFTAKEKTYSVPMEPKQKEDDPGVLEVWGKKQSISPTHSENPYRVGGEYSMLIPKNFYAVLHFGSPTIGAIFSFEYPSDRLEVSASLPTIRIEDQWIYDSLFMPGDHLNIRWKEIQHSASPK